MMADEMYQPRVPLKEYFERVIAENRTLTDTHFEHNRERYIELIDSLRDATHSRFDAEARARDKAFDSMNVRLEGMNEFRRQLDRQSVTFITLPQLLGYSFAMATLVFAGAEIMLRMLKL